MKTKAATIFCIIVFLTTLSQLATAAEDYCAKGFEPPTFEARSLDKQNGWRVVNVGGSTDDAMIQTASVHVGDQALELKNVGRRVVARFRQPRRATFFFDAMLQLPDPKAIKSNASIRLRGRDLSNKVGILIDVSFNGRGAVNKAPAGPNNKYKAGEWTRVTIKADFQSGTWDLYINGKLAGEDLQPNGEAGFRQIDTFDLDWTSKPNVTTGPGLMADDVCITAEDPLAE